MSDQLHEVRSMIFSPEKKSIYIPTQAQQLSFRGYAQFANERSAHEIAETATGIKGLTTLQRLGIYGANAVTGFALRPSKGAHQPRYFTYAVKELDTIQDIDAYDEIDQAMLDSLIAAVSLRKQAISAKIS